MERCLAAILAADVVGYSRLMGADEDRTGGSHPRNLGLDLEAIDDGRTSIMQLLPLLGASLDAQMGR